MSSKSIKMVLDIIEEQHCEFYRIVGKLIVDCVPARPGVRVQVISRPWVTKDPIALCTFVYTQ